MRASAGPSRRRLLRLASAGLGSAVLAGCGTWRRPAPGPMDLLHFPAPGPYAAPRLLAMLPGAYSRPEEFVDEGLVAALRERRAPVDVVVVGTELTHYLEGSVARRLHDDVIAPALHRGVRDIWLLGISLGGLLAMTYAARHPGQVQGIVAIAPYVGRRTLHAQLRAAGSAAAWARSRVPQADDEPEHEVWAWLGRGQGQPLIHLGYGRDDRFADGHRLLAAELPPERVIDGEGGHDWPCWRALWQQWLARGLFDTPPAAGRLATAAAATGR